MEMALGRHHHAARREDPGDSIFTSARPDAASTAIATTGAHSNLNFGIDRFLLR